MQLRVKLIVLLIPILLVPVGAVAWISYQLLVDNMVARSQQSANTLLALKPQNFQRLKSNATANLKLLEAAPIVEQYMLTKDEAIRYSLLQPTLLSTFSAYQTQYPDYIEIRVLLPDGFEDTRLTAGFVPNVTEEEDSSPFFTQWQSLVVGNVSSNVVVNPDSGEKVLLVGKKVMLADRSVAPVDAEKELRGYLGITVSLEGFAAQVNAGRFSESGQVLLSDVEGGQIHIGKGSSSKAQFDGARFPAALDTEMSVSVANSGSRFVYWSKPLQDGLWLTATVPEKELLAPTRSLAWAVLLVSVLALAVLMSSVYLIIERLLLRRLERIGAAANAIAEGKLGSQLIVESDDEIGRLSASFNEMQDGLRRTRMKVEEYHKELEQNMLQAQAANRAKSEFLAMMSHEIRTPMGGVLGGLELLLTNELTGRQRRLAQISQQSAKGLLRIIEDILDFSKIEAGRVELDHVAFNLFEDVTRPAVETVEESARAKGVLLDARIEDEVEVNLTGDPVRLQQVLLNLLGNAVKFTNEGSVTLRVLQRTQDTGNATIEFEVVDTGIGIERGQAGRIFHSFVQADNSSSRNYGGTGLGLAIARQLVELMDGQIGVESTPGKGSRFWFRVQLGVQPEERYFSVSNRYTERPSTTTSFQGTRVLLVEDNPVSQEVAQEMLHAFGCEVTTCANGEDALIALDSCGFDLVLMDCQMPIMDGYSAARALRCQEIEKGRDRIPVIAVTANASSADRDRALGAGMDDHLGKPYVLKDIEDILRKWSATGPTPFDRATGGD